MMKKFYVVGVLLAFVLLVTPHSAFAHTHMVSSSPEKDEQVEQPIHQIQLDFHTDIAPLSSFTVTGEQGAIELEEIQVEGARMTGLLAGDLENGTYTVDWKIVGEDGHPMEGSYSFSVNVPESAVTEEQTEPSAEDTSSNADTPANDNNGNAATDESVTAVDPDTNSTEVTDTAVVKEPSSLSMPMLIAGIVIIAIILAVVLVVMRRRRS
ncbi:copper resistance protein CopC [Paenibacillus sp. MSJ-6]|uniref:Copper resistance protein CopC n=2 Tax=Paenibacillus brevis TaxID=2841508 RepID=A0ABS6FT35_9BACL|nr:copper resistance protein CopC [Paenibacillus brevis]